MDDSMEARLVDNAFCMGIKRRNPPAGLVHHSGRGSQCRSLLLGGTLEINGIIPSMGAISSPGDNAVTESLLAIIKLECTNETTFKTRYDTRLTIFDYSEVFYNRMWMSSALGHLSPEELETSMQRLREAA
ncbi:IS3 family transposase [Thermophilibacter immobilis]|uniref:IS3 family transposase n=1 Tax=Thermophilibacter immobilis TaxID=2779519 RepID=A0A7S7M822_9ACTN|nr:IS3 family transposase [Thermophilibacter immobilis]QOY60343.1 IS3 family transposase [Thermophilibacter immobilis]